MTHMISLTDRICNEQKVLKTNEIWEKASGGPPLNVIEVAPGCDANGLWVPKRTVEEPPHQICQHH